MERQTQGSGVRGRCLRSSSAFRLTVRAETGVDMLTVGTQVVVWDKRPVDLVRVAVDQCRWTSPFHKSSSSSLS